MSSADRANTSGVGMKKLVFFSPRLGVHTKPGVSVRKRIAGAVRKGGAVDSAAIEAQKWCTKAFTAA